MKNYLNELIVYNNILRKKLEFNFEIKEEQSFDNFYNFLGMLLKQSLINKEGKFIGPKNIKEKRFFKTIIILNPRYEHFKEYIQKRKLFTLNYYNYDMKRTITEEEIKTTLDNLIKTDIFTEEATKLLTLYYEVKEHIYQQNLKLLEIYKLNE